jgi:pimeloyl-ACP methyl ester carboxylesterase
MDQSFASPQAEARFLAAYDEALAQWTVTGKSLDLPSKFGTTHVQACGPDDAPSLILLSGSGATSTVWVDNVEALSRRHRVYAIDTMGDVGRSVPGGRAIDTFGYLMSWLDDVLDRLGLLGATLVGHSYGAQLALNYALHAPHRVRSLALLDPTDCFAGLSPGYLLRAVPAVVRPSAARLRRLVDWETRGSGDLDPVWLNLFTVGAQDFLRSRPVLRRPAPARLNAVTVPTLVLLAEQSRAHDIARMARIVHRLMPRAVISTVPGASHFGLPMQNAAEVNRAVLEFAG